MPEESTQEQTQTPTSLLNGGGGAPAQPNPTPTAEWMRALPEDMRNHPSLARYKDLGTMARSYTALEARLSKSITPPGEDATPADREAFLNKLRGTDSLEKYDWNLDKPTLPEGMAIDATTNDWFNAKSKELSFKYGISAKDGMGYARELRDGFIEQISGQLAKQSKDREDSGAKNVETLKQEFGYDFDRRVAVASQMVGKLSEDIPGLSDFLDRPENVNNPVLVKLFSLLGEMAGEDTAIRSDYTPSDGDLTNAKEQLAVVMKADSPYWNADLPGHQEMVTKALRLNQVIAAGK